MITLLTTSLNISPRTLRLSNRVLVGLLVFVIAFLAPFAPRLLSLQPGYGLAGAQAAPEFKLRDASNQSRTLADFRGQLVYLMFGYLNCRDICHTQTLLFQEIERAADLEHRLVFLFIAIDPQRDPPQRVASYFDHRGENFISLHGDDPRQLQQLALAYNNFFYQEPNSQSGGYDINHGGNFYLIDPEGNIAFTYTSSQRQLPRLLRDLSRLDQEYRH